MLRARCDHPTSDAIAQTIGRTTPTAGTADESSRLADGHGGACETASRSNADSAATESGDLAHSGDARSWTDATLVAAVQREASDVRSCDALVRRFQATLSRRCQMLSPNSDRAAELAQQTWLRVLRARHLLDPAGNFAGYLTTVATNLWRDQHRSARRAGLLAGHRVASLEALVPADAGGSVTLADILPDPQSLRPTEQALMNLDLQQALAQLPAHLREVIVARYVDDESCASIGLRYERTEQAISGWVREAVRQMKRLLEEPAPGDGRTPRDRTVSTTSPARTRAA